ncbi:MAG: Chaperone protein HtpG [Candidatus Anoxychlamydiales bacterium]|nr:Chaperone protein HtpG [Candidatus Anoxychlamydiales bacterium]
MEKKLSIHSENILPIIKKWLYSDRDIFLRELVSNSSDAITKLKILKEDISSAKIDITIDKKNSLLIIDDNGIGMTKKEVEKYISQIAFSGAEDFMKKYEAKDSFIGHFGLGFYSSFMASTKVEIETKSYLEKEKAVIWSSTGTSTYTIEEGSRANRGTKITLFIDDENKDFLEEEKVKETLLKYTRFLSYPIFLNTKKINDKEPLWIKNPKDITEKEYLDFYKTLYPFDPDPIFWVHINIDYPFELKGILYFPKIQSNYDIQSSKVKLFSNRIFVSDNLKEILPDFLTVLKGSIESNDIPLNVSRSYLQMNKTVKQLGAHISKKIFDKLSTLYKDQKDKFISYYPDIEVIIKLGILQEEKLFEKAKNFLIYENTNNNWLTIDEYISKSKTDKKIFYTHKNKHTKELLDLYKDIEVIYTNPYIDSAMINLLESKLGVKFVSIEGSIDDSIIDKENEKNVLDSNGQTISAKLSKFFKSSINTADLEVEAKSLKNKNLPSFLMIKEEDKRLNDYMTMQNQNMTLPIKKTLVINTSNPLIEKIEKLQSKDPALAKDLTKQIYGLAKLSQKDLSANDLSEFVTNSTSLLEKLVNI